MFYLCNLNKKLLKKYKIVDNVNIFKLKNKNFVSSCLIICFLNCCFFVFFFLVNFIFYFLNSFNKFWFFWWFF